ncbi:probable nucleoporin Nup54 [Culicoides brevitarsis]|uniref:probable nucleoporin Nup54 n=1 Tax=Culicoides brevitarsis TaxID=469753 RepID=UPI00307BA789
MAFSFGATSTPAKPATGFGQNTTFGFGNTSTFGAAPAAATTTVPSLFGATNTNTFGTSTFGQATATTSAPSLFGTQQPATNTGLSLFGQTNTAFGQPQQQQQQPTLTGFGQKPAGTAWPAFGSTTTTSQPSTGFGTGTSFGGFGTTFGQNTTQQQQMQQQQQLNVPQMSADEQFLNAVFNVSIFGDERDATVAKWNHLQAMWGVGKAFYSNQPPVEIDQQNLLSRFKTMGYSKLSGKDNKAGLIAINFNKPVAQVKDTQQQVVNTLTQIFGNKPNLSVHVESTKPLSDTKSQLIFYVQEKSATNETRKIPSQEVYAFINGQTMSKQQLTNLGVENIFPFVLPDEDQLKEYLENPPKGIDRRMWNQAREDNPDPKKFIPVPMIGFNDLKWRIKCQENETDAHALYLQKVEKDLNALKQRHANTSAKIMEHRRKLSELSHRVLKIIVKQESTRKMGIGLSAEEEAIRTKLDNMHIIVSAPTQFKGRLSELLSQTRMQRNQWRMVGSGNEYTLDKDAQEEMKSFLTMQQKAMAHVIDIANKDLADLKIIQEGITRLVQS